MTTIITGNFEQQEEAEAALSALADAGFPADQTARFFVHPPTVEGPHPSMPPTEPLKPDQASAGAMSGAVIGGVAGAAVGIAATVAVGPLGPLAGAGVGAYVGSLAGAMAKIEDQNTPQTKAGTDELPRRAPPRKAGTLVGVVALDATRQETAIAILQAHEASDIDRSEGTISGGLWTDFDRAEPLHRVATTA